MQLLGLGQIGATQFVPMCPTLIPVQFSVPESVDIGRRDIGTMEWQRRRPGRPEIDHEIQTDWQKVAGLPGSLGTNGICSNYAYDQCEKTWETIRDFKGGTAIVTIPNTPIKCGGAPQKIMYLADDAFRLNGVRTASRIIYATGTPSIFAVNEFAATLLKGGTERHRDVI
ncbi:MAG: hypothetical protein NVS4B8_05410 [Herpetosiphon sp.]